MASSPTLAQNRVSEGLSDASGSLRVYITRIKTFLLNVAADSIEFFEQLPATVKGVQAAFTTVMNNIRAFFERTAINLEITYKRISKLSPFGKTSEELDREIEALRSRRDDIADAAQSVAGAYREAFLAELVTVERRREVSEALMPPPSSPAVRRAARETARQVVDEVEQALEEETGRRPPVDVVAQLGTRAPGQVASTGQGAGSMEDQQELLKNRFLQALITEEEYERRRYELMQRSYDQRLAYLAEAFGRESAQFIALQNEKLEAQKNYEEGRTILAQKSEEAKRQMEQGGIDALNEFLDATVQLLGAEEKARKRNAQAIKAFQIGKITIAGVTEVQKIWENAAAFGPLQSAFAVVQTLAATARTAAAIQQVRSSNFYQGGYTGNKALFADNQGRPVVGAVHANEWVAPEWQTQHPVYGQVIGWLENMRKRGFQEGGFATEFPGGGAAGTSPGGGPGFDELKRGLQQLAESNRQMAETIRRKQFSIYTGQVRDALDEDYRLDRKSAF